MLNRYVHLVHNCRPIKILQTDSASGSRIGGRSPDGIFPAETNDRTRYLVTIALNSSWELSIFSSVDYDEGSPTSVWENATRLHTGECSLVQCVVHPPVNRTLNPQFVSDLSGHSLEIQNESPDIVVEPGGELLLPSKIGGRPYFYYPHTKYIDSVNRILGKGFIYLLQLTWPGPTSHLVGRWPFGELTFHLFAKQSHDGVLWRYGWG